MTLSLRRAWFQRHNKLKEAATEEQDALTKFIEAQKTSGDVCSSRLLEAKRSLDGLLHDLKSLSTQVEDHETVLEVEDENLKATDLSIDAVEDQHEEETTKCTEEREKALEDLAQYTAELEELKQIAKPSVRYEHVVTVEGMPEATPALLEEGTWTMKSCEAFVAYAKTHKDLKFTSWVQDGGTTKERAVKEGSDANTTASRFQDLGAGCCSGQAGQSRLELMAHVSFKGPQDNLKGCKDKCKEVGAKKCGFIEYGWTNRKTGKNTKWCVVHPPETECSSTKTGTSDCGSGGGDNGVHAYKFLQAPAPKPKGCALGFDTYNDQQIPANCRSKNFPVGQKFCVAGTTYTVTKSWDTSLGKGRGVGATVDHEPVPGRGTIKKGTKITFGSCGQEPFNCLTKEQWTPEKEKWCCENKNIGCRAGPHLDPPDPSDEDGVEGGEGGIDTGSGNPGEDDDTEEESIFDTEKEKNPIELNCNQQREKLQKIFSKAYNSVKDLKKDAKERSEDNTCQETANAKKASLLVPLVAQREQAAARIEYSESALSALAPVLKQVESRVEKLQAYVNDKLTPECEEATEVSKYLQDVRDLIISLQNCPGRDDFTLKIPSDQDPESKYFQKCFDTSYGQICGTRMRTGGKNGNGHYVMTPKMAQQACKTLSSKLCTLGELRAAFNEGIGWCSWGFVKDDRTGNDDYLYSIMQGKKKGCPPKGINGPKKFSSRKGNAWCCSLRALIAGPH